MQIDFHLLVEKFHHFSTVELFQLLYIKTFGCVPCVETESVALIHAEPWLRFRPSILAVFISDRASDNTLFFMKQYRVRFRFRVFLANPRFLDAQKEFFPSLSLSE